MTGTAADRRSAVQAATLAYPDDLPITARREDLVAAIRANQVVIVAGETGSGKSTQLPKLCLEAGRGLHGYIGHTQPRRIAARSIAERVAEETRTELGKLVGYKVRFADRVGERTVVKVMTDGVLLAEIHRDRRLRRYDTIIVDEAHERSLTIDFLLGYLRALLPRRPDLKVIITSATIDTERFSAHFDGAPVVEVSGRAHPVEVRYRPLDDPAGPERDQPQAICDAVVELSGEGSGDILVFCSGEREIRDAAEAIAELALAHTEVLPLYGRLSAAEQHRVFRPHTGRRIVLATNVAETSLTVPGIRYVVDPGAARISRYGRRTKVQRLPIEPISQASADQRAGRCGRLGPGVCIRLYSEDDFASRPEFTEPEILRTSLASVILQMTALELGDVESFPFLDRPDVRAVRDGIDLLTELGALDPAGRETGRRLTPLGRRMAHLPLDPRLARMVIEADRNGCLREVLVIAAALSIQDPRERPTGREQAADQAHARFVDPDSDFLSWLRLWEHLHGEQRARTSSQFRRMCRDEFLNYRRIREWQDVHSQLRGVTDELRLLRNATPAAADAIHRSLLTGLLAHVGRKDPDGHEYRGTRGARFSIAPGSTLFKRSPEWVMAGELVETSRLWARNVCRVRPEWVEQAARHLVRRSYSDPWWDPERGAALATETVTLYGLTLVSGRTVAFGRIDPAAARALFIRHALVGGEWEAIHEFVARNRERVEEVRELEARGRLPGLLVDEDAIATLFDARLPEGITSVRHFDAWWKTARLADPNLLDLSLDDLVDPSVPRPDEASFPRVWTYGDLDLPIEYRFEPEDPADGITVDLPVASLERIDPAAFEWHVPGLRAEVVDALVRSLPKSLRRRFVPIPETVRTLLTRLRPEEGGLVDTLRRELAQIGGAPIPPNAFDPAALPPHLRPRFRVVDGAGEVLAEGRDLGALKGELRQDLREAAAAHPLEQTGLTRWSIGELPRVVDLGRGVRAYPALVDEGDTVAVRLLATREEQAEAMWDGVRRLLVLGLPSPTRLLRPLLTEAARRTLRDGPYDEAAEWAADCLTAALDRVLAGTGGLPWDGVTFDALVGRAREEIADGLAETARTSLEILALRRSVLAALDRSAVAPATLGPAVDDILEQLERLVYPGFLTSLGADRLADVARYLRAIERRLERLPEHPARDAELMATVRRLEQEHDRLRDIAPQSEELLEVGWMLQELRVSLFAQALGTRGSVSEQRIRRVLEKVATGA